MFHRSSDLYDQVTLPTEKPTRSCMPISGTVLHASAGSIRLGSARGLDEDLEIVIPILFCSLYKL